MVWRWDKSKHDMYQRNNLGAKINRELDEYQKLGVYESVKTERIKRENWAGNREVWWKYLVGIFLTMVDDNVAQELLYCFTTLWCVVTGFSIGRMLVNIKTGKAGSCWCGKVGWQHCDEIDAKKCYNKRVWLVGERISWEWPLRYLKEVEKNRISQILRFGLFWAIIIFVALIFTCSSLRQILRMLHYLLVRRANDRWKLLNWRFQETILRLLRKIIKTYHSVKESSSIYEQGGAMDAKVEVRKLSRQINNNETMWNTADQVVPVGIVVFFMFMMRQAQGQNNQAMGFGKVRARLYGQDKERFCLQISLEMITSTRFTRKLLISQTSKKYKR